jgi:methionyl-tRNA synthetase
VQAYAISHLNPWLLGALIVWSLLWKGIALWHSARNTQTAWYVVILILNTVGILEIVYLLFFRPKGNAGLHSRPSFIK